MKTFTAYLEWAPETNLYVGFMPGNPGAHSRGKSLDELRKNLKEVFGYVLKNIKMPAKICHSLSDFSKLRSPGEPATHCRTQATKIRFIRFTSRSNWSSRDSVAVCLARSFFSTRLTKA